MRLLRLSAPPSVKTLLAKRLKRRVDLKQRLQDIVVYSTAKLTLMVQDATDVPLSSSRSVITMITTSIAWVLSQKKPVALLLCLFFPILFEYKAYITL